MRQWHPSKKDLRDGTLFLAGLGIALNEALLTRTERPTVLLLAAAMMGLPAFLRSDEKRNGE